MLGHDPRRHRGPAGGRGAAVGLAPRDGDRRGGRRAGQRGRLEDLPEIVQRGAQVLGAQSSALAIFDSDGGPLRLHMTNRLTDEVQVHVEYPVAGLEIELDETQPTQYAAIHGRRVLLADREEALARFPATREGLEVLGMHADRRAAAARRGAGARLVRGAVGERAHLRRRRRRGARGARRPDRAQRLAPAGRPRSGPRPSPRCGRPTSGCRCSPRPAGSCRGRSRSTSRWASWPRSSSPTSRTGAGSSSPTTRAGCTSWPAAHRDPSRNAEVADYVRSMVAVMTDEAAARVVTRTGRPMIMPEVDWDHVERSLPDMAAREALARIGRRVRRPSSPWSRAGRPSARWACSTARSAGR